MAEFDKYFPKLIQYEGGYVNDPDDAGGETYKGIARNANPDWEGWATIDPAKTGDNFPDCLDDDDTLAGLVSAFYKAKYWDTYYADEIENQATAELLVDWEVNSGHPGIRIPQQILGIAADGVAGPATVAAINAAAQPDFFNACKKAHEDFYTQLVQNNPRDEKYLKGWENRLNQFNYEA